GGNEQALTAGQDFAPSFTPDGADVLFSRHENDRSALYRVPILGGEPRKILDDADAGVLSPDGKWIAFVRRRQQESRAIAALGVVAAGGGEPRELASEYDISAPTLGWSPDGRRIIYSPSRGNSLAPREYHLVDPA